MYRGLPTGYMYLFRISDRLATPAILHEPSVRPCDLGHTVRLQSASCQAPHPGNTHSAFGTSHLHLLHLLAPEHPNGGQLWTQNPPTSPATEGFNLLPQP